MVFSSRLTTEPAPVLAREAVAELRALGLPPGALLQVRELPQAQAVLLQAGKHRVLAQTLEKALAQLRRELARLTKVRSFRRRRAQLQVARLAILSRGSRRSIR